MAHRRLCIYARAPAVHIPLNYMQLLVHFWTFKFPLQVFFARLALMPDADASQDYAFILCCCHVHEQTMLADAACTTFFSILLNHSL
jgi:hypothetical protein